MPALPWLYYPIQRYKFESNSQQSFGSRCCSYVVLSDTKIQIWKQFTTERQADRRPRRCIIRYKDTNLKAIHNCSSAAKALGIVVLSDTKIQIWKQVTTSKQVTVLPMRCIIRYKDTNLKAIHNLSGPTQ